MDENKVNVGDHHEDNERFYDLSNGPAPDLLDLSCSFREPTDDEVDRMFYVVHQMIELSADDTVFLWDAGVQVETPFLIIDVVAIDLS
jgi:hypothetical protein